jgi:hypothetical protein
LLPIISLSLSLCVLFSFVSSHFIYTIAASQFSNMSMDDSLMDQKALQALIKETEALGWDGLAKLVA